MSYDGITSFHQGELRDVENIFGQSQSYGRMSEIWRGKQTIFVWDRRFFDSLLGKVPKEKPFSITFDLTDLQQSVCEANLHYWENKEKSSICMMESILHCCNLRSLGCGWDAGGPGVWGFCWWLAFDDDDETWQVRLSEFNKKKLFCMFALVWLLAFCSEVHFFISPVLSCSFLFWEWVIWEQVGYQQVPFEFSWACVSATQFNFATSCLSASKLSKLIKVLAPRFIG